MKKVTLLILTVVLALAFFSLPAVAGTYGDSNGGMTATGRSLTGIAVPDFYADEEAAGADCFSVSPQKFQLGDVNYDGKLVLVIDPGHTFMNFNPIPGSAVGEADCNVIVAKAFKAYLESHVGDKITVYLTHDTTLANDGVNKELSIKERAEFAAEHGADLLISCQFNASGVGATGGEVYVSGLEEYALTDLGKAIMSGLVDLGIRDRGVKVRKSEDGTKWLDGRLADYYGIIYHPACRQIPACLVEHCFYDTEYETFMNTEEKLKAIGESDAKAVISYFGLDQTEKPAILEYAKTTGLNELNSIYEKSKDIKEQPDVVKGIYDDAVKRINAANNTGKIVLVAKRAYRTIQNYPNHTHSLEKYEAKDATCTEAGNTAYWSCSGCPKYFSDAEGNTEIQENSWVIPALGHSWDNGVITKEPTTSCQGIKTYTCTRCEATQTEVIPTLTPSENFDDVEAGDYFYDAVNWAVTNGVTAGTSAATFSPDAACTRGQVVTLLWRAAGCPEPAGSVNSFVDVKAGTFYYKPVLWAVEKGITAGMDEAHFAPQNGCTRGQVVTFLWRANGKPAAANPFTDVKAAAYYYNAVLWAVKEGITAGTSATTFSPDLICTRGQAVTFLFRAR